MSPTALKTLSAGHELLPTLGNDLRDLSGLHTLVYEMMQNADDAEEATEMVFDVTDSDLLVQNDGVFSDCGTPEASECAGVVLNGEHVRCDFHSFLKISGQAKRQKAGTTGAFGIGFTSVFQVTDYPELLSAGRHWRLRYDEPLAANVHICVGCARDHRLFGTTFVLPWARDPDSAIRRGLGVPIPDADVPSRLIDVARECIPGAMVFLRRLKRIEVRRNGRTEFRCTRSETDPWTLIDDGSNKQSFYVLKGDFEDVAGALRTSHPSLLGIDVREPSVTIAVPTHGDDLRLPLHAVLPTQESAPLGFRLSASFYPFQDRKRLKFESEGDGESEWNRAAVRAGAALLAEDAEALARSIGPERAWRLFRAAHDVSSHIEDAPDPSFSNFWQELEPQLCELEIVWTADEQWMCAEDVVLLEPQWHRALDVLQELGISVVNPSIANDVATVAKDIGVPTLDLERLASAIRIAGITEVGPAADLPGRLGNAVGLNNLLAIIADLVGREEESDEPLSALNGCAIIPCHDGVVASPETISAEDVDTRRLYEGLPELVFADLERIETDASNLRRVLWPLLTHEVIAALSSALDDERLDEFFKRTDARDVLRWFAEHAKDFDDDDIATLRSLPIFPTLASLRPLDELDLPGPFKRDPLGIAATVDLIGIEDLRSFLGADCLGADTLSFDVYVRDRLLPAMSDGQAFDDAALDRLLDVLASNIDDIDHALGGQLAELPLLPTSGGRRAAIEAYFDNDVVREVLGDAFLVSMDERLLRRLKPLLELLGVTTDPRPSDIVAVVEETVSKPKTRDRIRLIRRIIEHIGPRFRFAARQRDETFELLEEEFGALLVLEWMPVADTDEWAAPDETYRTEWRTAFESTGKFVDLPEKVQQANADLLELLGVQMRPNPELVVGHLLNCASSSLAVAKRAYEALDGADREAIALLRNEACILVERTPAVRYSPPSKVVGDPGALHRYLSALPKELAVFQNLVENLEIADHPQSEHAIEVLRDLGGAASETPSSEQELAAAEACWRILEDALHGEGESWQEDTLDDVDESEIIEARIQARLADRRTWPDRRGVLRRPSNLYIDDRPALRQFIPDAVLESLVDRPRFGTTALAAAGLQFLSVALVEEIVRVPNVRDSTEFESLLRDREDALARVVSAETGTTDALRVLRGLETLEADKIVVHRAILGDVPVDLGEHPVTAHLDRDGNRLFVQRLNPPPWTEVAVEIAVLLRGDRSSPGPGAGAAIEKVLTADTANAAHAALDLLQIPRIDSPAHVDLGEEVTADALFDEELPGEELIDDVVDEPRDESDDQIDAAGGVEPDLDGDDVSLDDATDTESADGSGEAEPSAITPKSLDGHRAGSGATRGRSAAARATVDGSNRSTSHPDRRERNGAPPRNPDIPWRVWVSGRRGKQQQERSESEANTRLRGGSRAKGS